MPHFVVGFVLVPLLVVVGLVILMAKMFQGAFSRRQPQETVDDTRMIQEIYQKLSGMEQRIEVLETLLVERTTASRGASRKDGSDDKI